MPHKEESGLPEGGDIVGDLKAQKPDGPEKLQAGMEALADEAEVAQPARSDEADSVPELRSSIGGEPGTESKNAEPNQPIFPVMPVGEFLKQPDEEMPWVVERLLPAGGISILTAKPKVGKSTLVRSLILDVARGRPFLGRATKQGSAIYLCLEDIGSEVRKSFRSLGATDEDTILIYVGGVNRDMAVKGLLELIREHNPVLIVIDTISKFVEIKNFDDYAQVSHALGFILRVARVAEGCHFMFLHHAPKTERGGGDDVLGSTAFYATVDTVINMVKKKDRRRFVYADQQRYGADLPETEVAMDPETGRITGGSAEPFDPVEAGIRNALASGDLTRTQIRGKVQGRYTTILETLDAMVEVGEVVEARQGSNGNARRYSLTPASTAQDSVPGSHPIGNAKREHNSDDESGPSPEFPKILASCDEAAAKMDYSDN